MSAKTMKSGYKIIGQHGAMDISSDYNGCAILIFREIFDNDSATNSH